MATTPNYSWIMPDPTDLVKDLPADFAIFGNAVDSTVKTNADAAIAKTIVDAKGDIIAATAADTVSRLAVGANNTVLTADSSTATGLKWAAVASGGMTLLSTTTLSGASTTISNIDQTYTNLYILVTGVTNATADGKDYCSPNFSSGQTVSAQEISNGAVSQENNYVRLTGNVNRTRTDANNSYQLQIYNYASTTFYKPVFWSGYFQQSGGSRSVMGGGGYYSNSAVTSLNFFNDGGNLSTGTVRIYGVK